MTPIPRPTFVAPNAAAYAADPALAATHTAMNAHLQALEDTIKPAWSRRQGWALISAAAVFFLFAIGLGIEVGMKPESSGITAAELKTQKDVADKALSDQTAAEAKAKTAEADKATAEGKVTKAEADATAAKSS